MRAVLPNALQILANALINESTAQQAIDEVLSVYPVIANHASISIILHLVPKMEACRQRFFENPQATQMLSLASIMIPQVVTMLPVLLNQLSQGCDSVPPFFSGFDFSTMFDTAADHNQEQEQEEEAPQSTPDKQEEDDLRNRPSHPYHPFGRFGPSPFCFGMGPFGMGGPFRPHGHGYGHGPPKGRGQGRGPCHRGGPKFFRRNWRSCGNGMRLKADEIESVNLEDRTEVAPSQTLIKTWRVKNTGECAWPQGTKLLYIRGNLPSLENDYDISGPVQAGEAVEVNAVVRTPAQPGRYRAFFKLADPDNNRFGRRLWCDLMVVKEAAVAASPTTTDESKKCEEKNECAAPDVSASSEEFEVVSKPVAAAAKDQHDPAEQGPAVPSEEQYKYHIQLEALKNMGWTNEELVKHLLEEKGGNVQVVCNWLLQNV